MFTLQNFLASWPFNLFILLVNFVMLIAFGLIINHQNFKDLNTGEFMIDMIIDTDRVPASYLWVRIFYESNYLQGITVVISHAMFLYYKWLEHTLLEWTPHPTQNM